MTSYLLNSIEGHPHTSVYLAVPILILHSIGTHCYLCCHHFDLVAQLPA